MCKSDQVSSSAAALTADLTRVSTSWPLDLMCSKYKTGIAPQLLSMLPFQSSCRQYCLAISLLSFGCACLLL